MYSTIFHLILYFIHHLHILFIFGHSIGYFDTIVLMQVSPVGTVEGKKVFGTNPKQSHRDIDVDAILLYDNIEHVFNILTFDHFLKQTPKIAYVFFLPQISISKEI